MRNGNSAIQTRIQGPFKDLNTEQGTVINKLEWAESMNLPGQINISIVQATRFSSGVKVASPRLPSAVVVGAMVASEGAAVDGHGANKQSGPSLPTELPSGITCN